MGNVCKAGLCTVGADTVGGVTGCCLGRLGEEFCKALLFTGVFTEDVLAMVEDVASAALDRGADLPEAGEARGLKLLLFVFGFKLFF